VGLSTLTSAAASSSKGWGGRVKQAAAATGRLLRIEAATSQCFCSALFLFGFAKNDRDNIDASDLRDVQRIARQGLGDHRKMEIDVKAGVLIGVQHASDR
jgi:hypothetical protein